ncbi:MAG: hypothetical protein ACLUI3_05660 [Christensenellales bacterium]
MRTNATEDEFKWFGRVKGMTYNAVSAGVAAERRWRRATACSALTRERRRVQNNFDSICKGYSIDFARYLSAVNTGLTARRTSARSKAYWAG